MYQMLIHKTSGKPFVLICFILLLQTSLVWAADEITGDWEITMEFNGRKSYAALSITKNEDGTLKGKWGRYELDNVKFQDGKITFSRTMGPSDRQFTTDYKGTLKEGKLMLTIINDWGELSAVGARPKPMCPALGQWDINFRIEGFDMELKVKLTIFETKDGKLEGKWIENIGEHSVSNIKFENGKLSLTRQSKVEEREFESTYVGTIKGDELIGTLSSEMGDIQANGKRFGTELIGEWELTSVSDWGTRTTMMKIFSDLTGRYEFFGSDIPMKNIKLEGYQLTFILEMGWGDQTFELNFKGKLDGKNLKGQMESDRGTSDITGKKIEVKKVPAVSIPAALIGKWELTTTSERGERTRMLTIKEDMTGTYEMRDGEVPIKDLKVEGNQVTFKVEMSFGDRQFEMDFKGQLKGQALEGEFTTSRGTMKATGKKM